MNSLQSIKYNLQNPNKFYSGFYKLYVNFDGNFDVNFDVNFDLLFIFTKTLLVLDLKYIKSIYDIACLAFIQAR